MHILERTDDGLYCEAGDFFVDPWRPVDIAVVTHAHADHARWGCGHYVTSERGASVLRQRVAADASIQGVPYGERLVRHGVSLSFHPAGHLLGSAQVRIEYRGQVWVVSGDYKTVPDPTCLPFEPVPCHTFVTECTFGLPIYRWPSQEQIFQDINEWWRGNVEAGRTSLLLAYALGKAQRALNGLDAGIGPILVHGAVNRFLPVYRDAGIALPDTQYASFGAARQHRGKAMVVAPPSAAGTPWIRKFGTVSAGFASGWMRIRGARRRRAVDRGFILSDHCDWPGLLQAIDATGAENILLTHGQVRAMKRWLTEQGRQADIVETGYRGYADEDEAADDQATETP